MGLFDGDLFDLNGDGKTDFVEEMTAFGAFELFNEYCDLKDKQKQNQADIDSLLGKNK